MIDLIKGQVKRIEEKSITIFVNGFGLKLNIANSDSFQENKEAEIFTYLHWNQEKGPSLFGFKNELERHVFLMIIDCPKIGPGIAINILNQIRASQLLEIITSNNETALSSINGIGPKKAEQIIAHLKHKVKKFIESGKVEISESDKGFTQWQSVKDALTSLNYTNQEIIGAVKYLSENYKDKNLSLDQLIRSSLAYLSQKTK